MAERNVFMSTYKFGPFTSAFFGQPAAAATKYKIEYLKSIITKKTIYKYISFTNDVKLNNEKLDTLKEESLWFSHHRHLNDLTEYSIEYDPVQVSVATKLPVERIRFIFETMQDLYEICSFTYNNDDSMWNIYGNNGSGICIAFYVNNYDILYIESFFSKYGSYELTPFYY